MRKYFAHFEFNSHLGLELSESKSRVVAPVMVAPSYQVSNVFNSLSSQHKMTSRRHKIY